MINSADIFFLFFLLSNPRVFTPRIRFNGEEERNPRALRPRVGSGFKPTYMQCSVVYVVAKNLVYILLYINRKQNTSLKVDKFKFKERKSL